MPDKAPSRSQLKGVAFTVVLIGLIAIASFDIGHWSFIAVLFGSVVLAVIAFDRLFPESRLFVVALANSLGIYACVFQFFVDANFKNVGSPALELGFSLPILAFLAGGWRERDGIRRIIALETASRDHSLRSALLWLAPVFAVGALSFSIPGFELERPAIDFAFLGAMSVIGAMVFLVSPQVSSFLIDTGLLFEEFFYRARSLMTAAFAFITFYSVITIAFAAIFRIIDQVTPQPNFLIHGAPDRISFPDALYYSLITIATVGYGEIIPASNLARAVAAIEVLLGVLLLLFGFSEIMSYAKEKRHRRP
ncbi:MAG: two pore domain potassium channel family protein [Alphaproteobacteria bacterium]|nr:two pore domain potassium channel family protein [Alphaproteobacteria bacterium]